MAAASQQESDELMASINVTPFVDIVLVLLIILMVTSTHIVKASLQVDLPKAASGGDAVASTLNIVMTKEGETVLDGIEVSEGTLIERIRQAKADDPKVQAVIAADQGIRYGRVVRVIDLVKQNGVTQFALNIERTSSAKAP